MDQRFRRGFAAAEKTELWDRWQRGESLKAIGRAFSKPSSLIYNQVAPHGGIGPAFEELDVATVLGGLAPTCFKQLCRNADSSSESSAP